MSMQNNLVRRCAQNMSVYLMLFLVIGTLFLPLATYADHCAALKQRADDRLEEWAKSTSYWIAACAIHVAGRRIADDFIRENGYANDALEAACLVSWGFAALSAYWMAMDGDKYHKAAKKYVACLEEHDTVSLDETSPSGDGEEASS